MGETTIAVAAPLRGKPHPCKGTGCGNTCYGQRQLCDECYAKRLQCRNCGRPHGGKSGTTKLCKECFRGTRTGRPRGEYNLKWTEEEDVLIRRAYMESNARTLKAKICELFPTRPHWSVKRRAQIIGCAVSRHKEPPWSPEESALLEECAWMTPERIYLHFRKRGFKRTLTAICVRRSRLRLRDHIDGMSANSLAKTLGVDNHRVYEWIQKGWLAMEEAGARADGQVRRHIPNAAIRAFLLAHPEWIDLTKLERCGSKMWFLEMITSGQIGEDGSSAPPAGAAPPHERTVPLAGERVTLAALAEICGRPVAEIVHRIDDLGMSVDDAAFGAHSPQDTFSGTVGGVVGLPLAEPSLMSLEITRQVRALMKHHRAGVASVAAWTGLPESAVKLLLDGRLTLVSPALLAIVLKLSGQLRIQINA